MCLTKKKIFEPSQRKLRPDLDPGFHWNQLPYFFNLCVRHCDASIRPVNLPVEGAEVGKRLGQAMDHDCATGT
jgi:hypothetical protein